MKFISNSKKSFLFRPLPRSIRACLALASGAALMPLFEVPASAANEYWNTANGTWNSATNWSTTATSGGTGAIPGSGDTAIFNQSLVNGPEIVTLSAASAARQFTFANTGTTVLESASTTPQTLSIGIGGINVSGPSGNVTFGDTTNVLNIALAGNSSWAINSTVGSIFTINSNITNSGNTTPFTLTLQSNASNGAIILNGAVSNGGTTGTMALTINNGSTATFTQINGLNTYTGATTINSQSNATLNGTLGGGVGGGTAITFSAKNFSESSTGVIAGTSSYTAPGGGAETFNGFNTYTGVTSLTNNVLTLNGTIGGGTGGGTAITVTTTATQGGGLTESATGVIAGNSSLTVGGLGTTTVVLAGANTYTGATVLGGTNAPVTVSSGDVAGVSGALGVGGSITFSGGTLTYGTVAAARSDYSNRFAATAGQAFNINTNNNGVTYASPLVSSGGNLIKSGAGNLILTAANTYNGTTTVNAGSLVITNGAGLDAGSGGAVTVGGNAALNYVASTNTPLLMGSTLALTGSANGSIIGGSIGSTLTGSQISVAGAVTTTTSGTNVLRVNIFGQNGVTPSSGSYTLVSAGAASTWGTPQLSAVYNNTNFTVTGLSTTTTSLNATIAPATPLTTAYWKGGINNVWAVTNGSNNGNFVAASGGANQGLAPGAGADVTFSNSSITTAPTATILGANMSIKSLTIADTTNGLGLNADGYALTIAGPAGITVNASVPASTIAANVVLGANQTWTNNSANALAVSGNVSGASALTKAGTGTLVLSGANTYSGGTTISAGKVAVNNTNGSATGTGAVSVAAGVTLGGSGKIAPAASTAGVTLNGTLASGNVQTAGGTGLVDGSHLTLDNRTALSSVLTVNNGAKLSFNLGYDSTGGTGKLNFANPNRNSSFLNILGNTSAEVTFTSGATPSTITLFDLTAGTGNQLSLANVNNPYLLIQTGTGAFGTGSNSDFSGLVTDGGMTGGVANNGFVLGVDNGLGGYTPFTIDYQGTYGYTGLQLYLFDGNLEVVPEPGTWAMMLGGLTFLVFVQRSRKNRLS